MTARQVVVAGVGMTPFVKPGSSEPYFEMGARAVRQALDDAGIGYERVQQAFAGYVYGDSTCGQRTLYEVGLSGIPVVNVNNPWLPGPDRDKETALASRRRIFDRAATDRIPVLGFHFPFPGLGRILKTDSAYAWVPANWQF